MQCEDALTQIVELVDEALGYRVLSVPTDGSDVTSDLQAQINAVPDGTTFVLPPGRYRCEQTVTLSGRHDLTWEATGAVLYTTSSGPLDSQGRSNRSQVVISGSTNITIRGLRVESWVTGYDSTGLAGPYNNAYEFEHGFKIGPVGSTGTSYQVCEDITLDGCSVRDVGGDGVYVHTVLVGPQGNRWNLNAERVTLTDVLIEKASRQGIGTNGVLGLTVDASTIVANRTGIDLENIGGQIDNVLIRNCFVISGNGLVNAQSGTPECNNVTIEGNVIRGPGIRSTSSGVDRVGWTVRNNIWPGPTGDYPLDHEGQMFWFVNITGLDISDNYYRVGLKRRHNRAKNGAIRMCYNTNAHVGGNDFKGQNGQIVGTSWCTQDTAEVTVDDDGSVWVGPIGVNEPYPPEHDPNIDRLWSLTDFPQLDPPLNGTAGHWDGLARSTGVV